MFWYESHSAFAAFYRSRGFQTSLTSVYEKEAINDFVAADRLHWQPGHEVGDNIVQRLMPGQKFRRDGAGPR